MRFKKSERVLKENTVKGRYKETEKRQKEKSDKTKML